MGGHRSGGRGLCSREGKAARREAGVGYTASKQHNPASSEGRDKGGREGGREGRKGG